jgi:hypothetical protein
MVNAQKESGVQVADGRYAISISVAINLFATRAPSARRFCSMLLQLLFFTLNYY